MRVLKTAHCNNINLDDIEDLEFIKIDAEPIRVQILSEPCLVVTRNGYQPIVRIRHIKKKKDFILFISSKSISEQLEELRISNNDQLIGLEFWIRKESYDKKSKYILEE